MSEKLKKLEEIVTKELDQISEKGLTSSNLDTTFKLIDILKDIKEVDESEQEAKGGENMRYFERGGRGNYRENGYNGMYPMSMYENYRERGGNGGGYGYGNYENYERGGNGRYQHYSPDMTRFYEKVDRMMEYLEDYYLGKSRYRDGAHPGHMVEGLEKTMYAVCTLVESLMDSAETPEEKETIRKHIEKIKNI